MRTETMKACIRGRFRLDPKQMTKRRDLDAAPIYAYDTCASPHKVNLVLPNVYLACASKTNQDIRNIRTWILLVLATLIV